MANFSLNHENLPEKKTTTNNQMWTQNKVQNLNELIYVWNTNAVISNLRAPTVFFFYMFHIIYTISNADTSWHKFPPEKSTISQLCMDGEVTLNQTKWNKIKKNQ